MLFSPIVRRIPSNCSCSNSPSSEGCPLTVAQVALAAELVPRWRSISEGGQNRIRNRALDMFFIMVLSNDGCSLASIASPRSRTVETFRNDSLCRSPRSSSRLDQLSLLLELRKSKSISTQLSGDRASYISGLCGPYLNSNLLS